MLGETIANAKSMKSEGFRKVEDGMLGGYIPSRDGTKGSLESDPNQQGYRSNSHPPSFPHISRAADGLHTTEVILCIFGRLYKGGTFISGVCVPTDVDSIYDAMQEMQDGKSYNEVMKDLLGLEEEPIHVTGVLLKAGY
jgi:hypothetical protein